MYKRQVQKGTIERLLSLFSKINVWKGELSMLDLSLFIYAISESPIANVAFFPDKESGYIINAVKWFERMKSEKIKMLKLSQYTLLISFMFVLILLTALLSYMAFSDLRVTLAILSLLLSAFYFLENRLSRKADKN